MTATNQMPESVPPVDVLFWPEGAISHRPALEEGKQDKNALKPVKLQGLPQGFWHVLGLVGRSQNGYLNAAVHLDRKGSLVSVRAKSVLVPGAERSFAGIKPIFGTNDESKFPDSPITPNLSIQHLR